MDEIVNDNGLHLPPPSIRLGHVLHINQTKNYLKLLKKYNVTVEINASSNFALGNVKKLQDIPYRWYLENRIPVILGTDGGGFYLTTLEDEAKLAEVYGGEGTIKDIYWGR